MSKKKTLKKGKLFTVYLEEEHIAHIQRVSHRMSLSEGRRISASEAVRIALEELYPYSTQTDMFGDLNKKRRVKKTNSQSQLTFA
jgi:hypothetical protein